MTDFMLWCFQEGIMHHSFLGVLLSCALFAGCTSNPHTMNNQYNNPELEKALTGEVIFQKQVVDNELPEVDILALSDEMKLFAKNAARRGHNQDEKAELLHKALLSSREKGGRGIKYTVRDTGTAIETFDSRSANCLGYTLLYVAMARYLGLDAQVNQVMIPPTWYMDDSDSYFLMKHVNAKIKLRRFSSMNMQDGRIQVADVSDVVVDLEMRRYKSGYPQQILDDQAVEALFYNNKAMELLEKENYQQSFLFLRRALKSNNESFIWSNFGTLYWRLGELSLAEAVYQKALSLKAGDLSVLHNLAVLYEKMGRLEDAYIYREKVQNYRAENPYYLYQLAMKAKAQQDFHSAKKLIEGAIKRQKKDDRLFLLAAEVYELDGNARRARKMREKAEAISAIK
jgi:Flp pilus assembly protein TadD